ncbi:MAG: DUF3592 domain-containing protein [Pseudomonadota bacterium]
MRVFNIPYRLLLFASTTVLLIWCCFWIVLIHLPILDQLETRGNETQAEVTWVGEPYWVWQRGNYSRGGWRVDMHYRYSTEDGQSIEDKKTFVKQNAKYLEVGRRFDVVYLPEQPSVHHSDYGNGYAGLGMVYALIPLIGVCAFMTLFYWNRRPLNWKGPKLWPPISSA